MIVPLHGKVGKTLTVPLLGELEAIGFTSEVPFQFRLVRNDKPTALPLAIATLGAWQSFDPVRSELCYTLAYPGDSGTRGLEAAGLEIETSGLFAGADYTLLVWKRH